MAAIHPFGIEQRGSATSTSNFIRSLGMTIGITIFGTIQRSDLKEGLSDAFSGMGSMQGQPFGDSRSLLSEAARDQIPPQILDKITDALSSSIVHTFTWALVPAGIAFLFIFILGKDRLRIHKQAPSK
jgi:hypothetical protein